MLERRYRGWALGALLAAVGALAVGYGVWRLGTIREARRAAETFDRRVAERAAALERELQGLGEVLHSLRALFDASTEVTRAEFRTFVQGPLRRLPAVRAVEWAPVVSSSEREAYEAAGRAEEPGIEDLGVERRGLRERSVQGAMVPALERPRYCPVRFVEPLAGNRSALDFDLLSEARRRRALRRAAASDEPVLTDPVRLVQDPTAEPALLLLLAVRETRGQAGPEERGALRGFVLLAFHVADLLGPTAWAGQGRAARSMAWQLIDPDVGGQPTRLSASEGYDAGRRSARGTLSFGEQIWELGAYPTAVFPADGRSGQPLLVGILAAAVAALLGGALIHASMRWRRRTIQQHGLVVRSVLEHLTEGVVVVDRERRVVFANPAARRTAGLGPEAVRVGRIFEAGGCYLPDQTTPVPEAGHPLVRALAGETVEDVEIFLRNARAPHGAWLGASASAVLSKSGEIEGGVVAFRDLTERRLLRWQQLEMQLAAEVQRRLYPRAAPQVEGFDIAGAVFSAVETCGDYFDFIPLADDRFAIVIGDVSGHGLGPAMVMAQTRAYLRSFIRTSRNLDEIFGHVNRALASDLAKNHFVTLLVAILDRRTGCLAYANAGHIPAFVLDRDGRVRAELERTGVPLGIWPDAVHECREGISLRAGDVVTFLTDGITESRAPDGTFFLDRGALAIVRQHREKPAAEIVEHLHAGIRGFTQGRAPQDDQTMVVCKATAVLPQPVASALR
ncbi:MAG: SpoIIE family protein phosphatase [Planctomycetota bacterium]